MSKLITVPGPPVASVSRPDAIEQLYNHPRFPKNAKLADIFEENGKWTAKLKVAEFPPGGIADDDSDDDDLGVNKPPKKNKNDYEGPNGDNSDEPIDEGSDDESSDDSGAKGEGDKKDKGGEKHEIGELLKKVDALLTALGISAPGDDADSPVPGPEGGDVPDAPVPPPPGAGAPPHGGHGGPGGPPPFPTRGLKPGEAPPGSTPVGAPAFASVKDHPFSEFLGKVQSFEVSDITDKPLGQCIGEIKALVEPYNYYVHQAKATIDQDGNRRVAALVADHPLKTSQ